MQSLEDFGDDKKDPSPEMRHLHSECMEHQSSFVGFETSTDIIRQRNNCHKKTRVHEMLV